MGYAHSLSLHLHKRPHIHVKGSSETLEVALADAQKLLNGTSCYMCRAEDAVTEYCYQAALSEDRIREAVSCKKDRKEKPRSSFEHQV